MIGTPDQDEFITKYRWAVVTTVRKDGSPASSVVSFIRDGDELIFSSNEGRLKVTTLDRDPRMVLCVLDDAAPFGYVSVEGHATVEREDIAETHIRMYREWRGGEFEPPADFAQKIKEEGRVVIRLRPDRVSGVPNRRR